MNRTQMLLLDVLYPNRCDCCDSRIPYDRLLCDACTDLLMQQRIDYADWANAHPETPWEQGTVLFSTAVVILGNLVADSLYSVLDPRIRVSGD